MYKVLDGTVFETEAEVLDWHDKGKELHEYRAAQDEDDVLPRCYECGDDEQGIMHFDNGQGRNIDSVLLDEYNG